MYLYFSIFVVIHSLCAVCSYITTHCSESVSDETAFSRQSVCTHSPKYKSTDRVYSGNLPSNGGLTGEGEGEGERETDRDKQRKGRKWCSIGA